MSFYEDNIDDGSHCMSCCQYIGEGEGFPRCCANCGGGSNGLVHSGEKGAAKKAAKANALVQFKQWLAQTGVKHAVHNNGYHYVLTLGDGRLVDCWPSTKKWQLRGRNVSSDAKALQNLVRSSK